MNKSIDKNIPRHIAIIMDGNGRWAKQRGKQRSEGHIVGVEALYKTIEAAAEIGIDYLTVYAFSSENWQRPLEEVNALMNLMANSLEMYQDEFMKQGVSIAAIGDLSRLPEFTRTKLQRTIDLTSQNNKIKVIVALSYSSHWEINNALSMILREVKNGNLDVDDLLGKELFIEKYLSTKGIPDPDLLIRTGGEKRISNFLLYQIAYSELFFTDTLWPDFDKQGLLEAIESYSLRQRRFGKI